MHPPARAPRALNRLRRGRWQRLLWPGLLAAVAGACVTTKAARAPTPSPPEECVWTFAEYQPSAWEREWYEGEVSGERRDQECELLATPKETDRSVRLIRAVRGAVLAGQPIPLSSVELFSGMVYAEKCGPRGRDSGRRRTQLIEPLVGIVRDPLTICPRPPGVPDEVYNSFEKDEGPIQSKRHFLIGAAAPWSETATEPQSWRLGGFEPWAGVPRPEHTRARLNFLMDIGASTFGIWKDDPTAVGARWFVERYQRHRVAFDWIVSFEYDKIDPEQIYAAVPAEILPHYLYYDRPVEATVDGKWNPWRILRGMGARPEDYVVVKLDIDTPEVENPLIEQILDDPSLQTLLDEVFFEHHVNTKAMHRYWGLSNSPITLKDTYRNFTSLRRKGVRMHSWP
jgi:hypothetical protein